MTDLTEVCARHGITTQDQGGAMQAHCQWWAWYGADEDGACWGATEADAVCALLKARWGIGTVVCDPGQSDHDAVVALADRLRGVG